MYVSDRVINSQIDSNSEIPQRYADIFQLISQVVIQLQANLKQTFEKPHEKKRNES